jgi:molybdopterin converting factor small subunit
MKIRVLYLGLVRSKVGKKEEEYEIEEGSSLSNLLNSLDQTYGRRLRIFFDSDKENRLDPTFIATVNGTLKDPLQGNDLTLNDGDTVALMTLISGG